MHKHIFVLVVHLHARCKYLVSFADHVYSNTANSEFEPAEYASVIPKSQRQNVTKVNNTTKVYAALIVINRRFHVFRHIGPKKQCGSR